MKDNQLKTNEAFNAFAETVFESHILSEREKALISLASVISFEDPVAVNHAIQHSHQLSISSKEITYVSNLVASLKGKKIINLIPSFDSDRCC